MNKNDRMIQHWGADACAEVRRAQAQRDEAVAERLAAESREQLLRLAYDGLLEDLRADPVQAPNRMFR